MSTLYNIPGSQEDPLVDRNFLSNYLQPNITAGLDKLKQEIIKELTQTFNAALEAAKGEIKQEYQTAIEAAKSEVQLKASDTEPGEVPDNTVWFDKKEKLVKVKDGGDWIKFGAVYQ